MRYSDEFKLECEEMYQEGKYLETPEGISPREFHRTIRRWARIKESAGREALRHKKQNKILWL